MRNVILTIIMGLISLSSIAQSFCHTPALPQSVEGVSKSSRTVYNSNSHYFLKIYFHVLRASNGTGGVSSSVVQQAFNMLNSDFNVYNIYFVWDGNIDYINNSSIYLSPSNSIFTVNNHQDGIDIYIYPTNVTDNTGGYSNGFGNGTELYVAGQYDTNSFAATHVISHEMGHILNLYHTHHGTQTELGGDPNQCAELVNGSNSSDCGDYIEDTPADPGLLYYVDGLCNYTLQGYIFDANHDAYTPLTNLIMSYTRPNCMDSFTTKQVERMKAAIDNIQVIHKTFITISGPSIPCNNSVYSIDHLPIGYTVTWSLQNQNGPTLLQNTPTTNQCMLNKNGYNYINNTIVAKIKKNGTTVCTLTKKIDTGQNFSGYYTQDAHQYPYWYYPGISNVSFQSGNTIYLYRGSTITLTSNDFYGATLSYAGTTPLGWTHSGNTVSFHFSFFDINDPISPRSVNNSQTPASLTITGATPNGCDCFRFTVIGQIPAGYEQKSEETSDVRLKISSLSSQVYSITCNAVHGWEMSVLNSVTGETIYRNHVDRKEKLLNIEGWKSGIYIIKAIVGNKIFTEKIIVK